MCSSTYLPTATAYIYIYRGYLEEKSPTSSGLHAKQRNTMGSALDRATIRRGAIDETTAAANQGAVTASAGLNASRTPWKHDAFSPFPHAFHPSSVFTAVVNARQAHRLTRLFARVANLSLKRGIANRSKGLKSARASSEMMCLPKRGINFRSKLRNRLREPAWQRL